MPNSLSELHTLHAWEDNQITERCTQGEYAGKVLQFKLVDKDGAINLSNCLVQYAITRPDKTEDLLDCTVDNGVVKCNLTYSATSISGLVHGEVRVIGSNNSGTIKFYGVNLRVYKGVSDEAAEQSDEFTALIAALQKVATVNPDGSNTVTLDSAIVENGTNPVASGVIYAALQVLDNAKIDKDKAVKYTGSNDLSECVDNGVLYRVHDGTMYQILLCNSGDAYRVQYMFKRSGEVVFRTSAKSNDTWGAWSAWSPIGTTSNIADEAVTTAKVADDLAAVINAKEEKSNKKTTLTGNESRNEFYPSIKAVVDYLAANYLGSGDNTVSWANLAAAVQTLINGKESTSNKLTSEAGIDENSTDTEYPTAKAVYDFGADILTDVADDLVLRENLSNKKNAIAGNETSEQYYPTTKAVYDYVASSGLTESFKQALLNCFQNVAWINNRGQTFYQALYDALYPPKNLVSISAVFTQGNNIIYTTDSLDMLKQYLVVTAHYEDSSSKTITDYTLSGTLTAGTSVITVSYDGKTTTFNVTVTNNGIVIVIDGTSIIWELGYIAADGNITQELMQAGTYTSDFVNVGRKSQAVLALDGAEALRFAFYDSSKTFISRVLVSEADVPANAAYLRATIAKGSIGNDGYDGAGTTITLS